MELFAQTSLEEDLKMMKVLRCGLFFFEKTGLGVFLVEKRRLCEAR